MNFRSANTINIRDANVTLNGLYTRVNNLKKRYSNEHFDKLLNPIEDLIKENIGFTGLLMSHFKNILPRVDDAKSGIKRLEEAKTLSYLIQNLDLSNQNQTLVFRNHRIDEIYNEEIVQVSNVTITRFLKPTLHYDVLLPFSNKNYDPFTKDCTDRFFLPMFFRRNY